MLSRLRDAKEELRNAYSNSNAGTFAHHDRRYVV